MREKRTVKYFSLEEAAQMFKTLDNPREKLGFRLLYHYGLRVSELAGMKLSDFTPNVADPKEIYVRRLKNGISRHYPLKDDDKKALAKWLRVKPEGEWLFPSHNPERPLGALVWKRAHYALAARANLPEDRQLSIHAWRHSSAVHLLMNGADVKMVKDWLGHVELETTLIYTDLAPEHWTEFSQEALRRFKI